LITLRQSFVTAHAHGSGRAGLVSVRTGDLTIRGGGLIISSTFSEGDAGNVIVYADHLLISGDTAPGSTGIASLVMSGTGAAGLVLVKAGDLTIRGGGLITSSTFSKGDAGTVSVQADRLLISGDTAPGFFTGIDSSTFSVGNAGTVNVVTTGDLQVRNGAEISSTTFSTGNAGTVNVQANHLLVADEAASAFTGITSRGEPNSTGAGGAVDIHAQTLLLRNGGTVTTENQGSGPGGPIMITATDTLQLEQGRIRAQTTTVTGAKTRAPSNV
jgi:large exoprotein involved in heme utilization and adhesion